METTTVETTTAQVESPQVQTETAAPAAGLNELQSKVLALAAQVKQLAKKASEDDGKKLVNLAKRYERNAFNAERALQEFIDSGALSEKLVLQRQCLAGIEELAAILNPTAVASHRAEMQAKRLQDANQFNTVAIEEIKEKARAAGFGDLLAKRVVILNPNSLKGAGLFEAATGGITVELDGDATEFPSIFDAYHALVGQVPRRSKKQLNTAFAAIKRLTKQFTSDGQPIPNAYDSIRIVGSNGEELGHYVDGKNAPKVA